MEKWKSECGWDNMNPTQRIEYLEKNEKFDVDVLDDPPTIELKPEKIDYLRKKWYNKIKRNIANFFAHKYIEKLIKKKHPRVYDGNKLLNVGMEIEHKECAGLFFSWDNTPRHKENGFLIRPIDKEHFQNYMDKNKKVEYMFINAWNEWAEGMILEPTEENGYQYLEWIKEWKEKNN